MKYLIAYVGGDGDAALLAEALGSSRLAYQITVYVVGVDETMALGAALLDEKLVIRNTRDPRVQFSEVIGVPDGVVSLGSLITVAQKRVAELQAKENT